MTSTLLPADHARYTELIDEFLLSADLEIVTAKQIRKSLEARVGKDLSSSKEAIQGLIIERFDRAHNKPTVDDQVSESSTIESNNCDTKSKSKSKSKSNSNSNKNRVKREAHTDLNNDLPPKKKVRKETSTSSVPVEADDEKFAKVLQAQENRGTRALRAATQRKSKLKTVKKKKVDKKSDKKVKASDESDVQAESDVTKKGSEKKKGAFHKQYQLSVPLAELIGESELSRPQVVKNLWKHIKAHNLQDPNDKRQIICDDQMRSVFKQDRVNMFTMNKLLAKQLYNIDE
ncbi:hypothetical protein K3495_g3065 [Podosphaera aphanis]|nr:hypothetical protein K3495_g3065 [Podosphaera aphanis]